MGNTELSSYSMNVDPFPPGCSDGQRFWFRQFRALAHGFAPSVGTNVSTLTILPSRNQTILHRAPTSKPCNDRMGTNVQTFCPFTHRQRQAIQGQPMVQTRVVHLPLRRGPFTVAGLVL